MLMPCLNFKEFQPIYAYKVYAYIKKKGVLLTLHKEENVLNWLTNPGKQPEIKITLNSNN